MWLARPKAPKAYQTESVKSLDDEQVPKLLADVRERAASGDMVGKRDYALLLLFTLCYSSSSRPACAGRR